jgi:hypothetical protein
VFCLVRLSVCLCVREGNRMGYPTQQGARCPQVARYPTQQGARCPQVALIAPIVFFFSLPPAPLASEWTCITAMTALNKYSPRPYLTHAIYIYRRGAVIVILIKSNLLKLPWSKWLIHRCTHKWLCKIWGFHGGDYEECRLLGCYAGWLL